MRRLISLGLVMTLVFSSAFLTACTPDYTSEFGTGFEWTEDLAEAYQGEESPDELSYSGPFYLSNFTGLDPYTRDYSAARKVKVDNMIEVVDQVVDVLNEIEELMVEQRGVFDWYMGEILALEPSIADFISQFDQMGQFAYINATELDAVNSISQALEDLDQGAEWGYLQYLRYALVFDMSEAYTFENEDFMLLLATFYPMLEADQNTSYQDLNKDLDEKLSDLSEDIDESLQKLYFALSSLYYEEHVLFTADYYFAQNTYEYTAERVEQMNTAISEYDYSKDYVSDETIAALQSSVLSVKNYNDSLKALLDSYSEDELVDMTAELSQLELVSSAYAYYTEFFSNLHRKVNGVIDAGKTVVGVTWVGMQEGAKKVSQIYQESGAHDVVKDTAQMAGIALETAEATLHSFEDTAQNVYSQRTWKDAWTDTKNDVANNFSKVHQNFVAGDSGGKIMRTAKEEVEKVENSVAKIVDIFAHIGGASKDTRAKLKVVTKTGVGFATGLSKSIYTVADPKATKGQTLKAIAEIVLTYTGGSGAAVGAPDTNLAMVLGNLADAEVANLFAGESKEYIQKMKEKLKKDPKALKKMTKADLKKFLKVLKNAKKAGDSGEEKGEEGEGDGDWEEPEFEDDPSTGSGSGDEGYVEEEEAPPVVVEPITDPVVKPAVEPEPEPETEPAVEPPFGSAQGDESEVGTPATGNMPAVCLEIANEIDSLLEAAGQGDVGAGMRINQLVIKYADTEGCEDHTADIDFMKSIFE